MEHIPIVLLIVIILYFGVLYLISHFVSRKGSENNAFFLGNRRSPWWVVAIAMVGTSISGVTFVSVPGWVRESDMTYMQMVFGFFFGYLVIAYVLLPLYYKLNLISIYGYLEQRYGRVSMKTGSCFFILSKVVGSATKMYLIVMILQSLVFEPLGIPFYVTVMATVLFIWFYTHRSGVKTIIWTDLLQTICFLVALLLIIYKVAMQLDLSLVELVDTVKNSPHSRIFVFDDWGSRQNFFKQFISGIFIVIVMTGLDQDMMQKNLTCKSLKDARKNMLSYGLTFAPINFLFLSLGILLLVFAGQKNIELPALSDGILPMLASQYLGFLVLIFFIIGIVAASFSSADSALTSITTSICVDLLGIGLNENKKERRERTIVHFLACLFLGIVIVVINYMGESSIINAIYVIVSYTYGPLLGLFSFGLFTKIKVNDKWVPYVCIAAPVLCYITEAALLHYCSYTVGYELLILNGLFTIFGLLIISKKKGIQITK